MWIGFCAATKHIKNRSWYGVLRQTLLLTVCCLTGHFLVRGHVLEIGTDFGAEFPIGASMDPFLRNIYSFSTISDNLYIRVARHTNPKTCCRLFVFMGVLWRPTATHFTLARKRLKENKVGVLYLPYSLESFCSAYSPRDLALKAVLLLLVKNPANILMPSINRFCVLSKHRTCQHAQISYYCIPFWLGAIYSHIITPTLRPLL